MIYTLRRILIVVTLITLPVAHAQTPTTIFRGRPTLRVVISATEQAAQPVSGAESSEYLCVITKIGDRYYWASRENKPLTCSAAGAFRTCVAEGGAGYIRIIDANKREAAARLGKTEATYDYVEHMTLGLSAFSYYGKVAR